MSEQWLSPDEAASLLGVHRRTILRACKRGDIPHLRIGKVIRIAGHRLTETAETPRPLHVIAGGKSETHGHRATVASSRKTKTGRSW